MPKTEPARFKIAVYDLIEHSVANTSHHLQVLRRVPSPFPWAN